MEAGFAVHLANHAAIKQYEGMKHTGDRHDARWLAHLLRLGILSEGYICDDLYIRLPPSYVSLRGRRRSDSRLTTP